jgi:hypothetical protein
VNKKYCIKGLAWSAIPIRNTKKLNFCEQNYKKLTSSKHFGGLGTLAGDVVVDGEIPSTKP